MNYLNIASAEITPDELGFSFLIHLNKDTYKTNVNYTSRHFTGISIQFLCFKLELGVETTT